MERVLVVDDDERLAEATAEILRRSGFEVDIAHDASQAFRRLSSGHPDVMLLDYELPDMNAPQVLDQLRGRHMRTPFPVLILTGARSATGDHLVGLEHGASDYLIKGLDRDLLVAKIRTAIRERSATSIWRVGPLEVDELRGEATCDGKVLSLQRKQFRLLCALARRPGQFVSRDELLAEIWSSGYAGYDHALAQAASSLRAKLPDGGWIETKSGFGYRLNVAS